MELTDKEKSLLNRISGQRNIYLIFSIVSVLVSLSLLFYYGLVAQTLNSMKIVIVILVLLAGRSHLRQYRSAVLLNKFKLWIDGKDG